jgi:N-acyl-D-amino-acid deacylase
MRKHAAIALLGFLSFATTSSSAPLPQRRPLYDLLIAGGTVIDGSGAARYQADVAVLNGRIVKVSRAPLKHADAVQTIDATGKIVAPGFIDLHAHLDPLRTLPEAESFVRQGVTTALGAPDGGLWEGTGPLGLYLDSLQSMGIGLNAGYMVGHNTVREVTMGMENRAPTPGELERMRQLVARAMHDGAWGLSTGLIYLPGAYAKTAEVVELAKVAADSGGFYSTHLRDEGLHLIDGVQEAIDIGKRAHIPIVLTHHKVVGQPMWGASARTLKMVDSARAAGIDVRLDQYPYDATYTEISILMPGWALAGGVKEFEKRLKDTVLRDSIVRGTVYNIINDRGGNDLHRVQFGIVPWMRELEGKTLWDWAEMRKLPPTPETGAQLVIEAIQRGGGTAIYHVLDEGDIQRIMKYPLTMIASDGRVSKPGDGHPHPRSYGTFPRVLGVYVREKHVISLEEAIKKMTSMPAQRLGLRDRGRIAEGTMADLVVFDAATVADRSTYQNPHQYPVGIDYVIVNGVQAVRAGEFMHKRAGRVLRHSTHPKKASAS